MCMNSGISQRAELGFKVLNYRHFEIVNSLNHLKSNLVRSFYLFICLPFSTVRDL